MPISAPSIALPSPSALDAAIARARSGAPAIAAAAWALDTRELAPECHEDAAVWQDPDGDLWLGIGRAIALVGDRRPGAIADQARAILRDGVFGPPEALRLARFLGGACFDPLKPGSPLGAPLPAAAFSLPTRLAWLPQGAAPRAAAFTAVSADDAPEMILARLEHLAQAPFARLGPTALPGVHLAADPEARADWDQAMDGALAAIASGQVGKVVLARAILLAADAPIPAYALWRALADRAPGTQRFYFQQGETAFLGASPERLFAQSGDQLRLDGLAGTAPRDVDPEQDAAHGAALLASEKDQREHAWVVTAITEGLVPYATTIDHPATPQLRLLPTVQHLHTPITATLAPDVKLGELLDALHPTPAVGGTPRAQALQLIAALERSPRGWYAGPVGWITADAALFAVAIRSAYVAGDRAAVMAGAGIVSGSQAESEWHETRRKAMPLVGLLTEEAP